jgi:hypothetical protein
MWGGKIFKDRNDVLGSVRVGHAFNAEERSMAEQFVPHFPTQPGKFYFVVDCPDTGKPIPFMEDESNGSRPYPRRPLIVSCAHCQMMHEIIVPTVLSLQAGPNLTGQEGDSVGDDRVEAAAADFIVRRDDAVAGIPEEGADFVIRRDEDAGDVHEEAADFIIRRDDGAGGDLGSENATVPDFTIRKSGGGDQFQAEAALTDCVIRRGETDDGADLIVLRDAGAGDDQICDNAAVADFIVAKDDIAENAGVDTDDAVQPRAHPDTGLDLRLGSAPAEFGGDKASIETRRRRGAVYLRTVRALRLVVLGTLLFLADSFTQAFVTLRHAAGEVAQFCAASATQVVVALRQVAFEVVHFSSASIAHVAVTLQHAAIESALFFVAFLPSRGEAGLAAALPSSAPVRDVSDWNGAQLLAIDSGREGLDVRGWLTKAYVAVTDAVMARIATTLVLLGLRVFGVADGISRTSLSAWNGVHAGWVRQAGALRAAWTRTAGSASMATAQGHALWSQWMEWTSSVVLRLRARAATFRVAASTAASSRARGAPLWPRTSASSIIAALHTRAGELQSRFTDTASLINALGKMWSRYAVVAVANVTLLRARVGEKWSDRVASTIVTWGWIKDMWSPALALLIAPALGTWIKEVWTRNTTSASWTLLSAWLKDVWSEYAAYMSALASAFYGWAAKTWLQRVDRNDLMAKDFDRAPVDRRQVLALPRRAARPAIAPNFVYHVDSPHMDLVRQSFNLMCAASTLANDHELREQPALRMAEAALEAFRRDAAVESEQQFVGLQSIVLALGAVGEPRGPDDASGAQLHANSDRGLTHAGASP